MRGEATNLTHDELPRTRPGSEALRLAAEKSQMPDLPAEAWQKGLRFHDIYSLLKRSVLLDDDILAWLRAGGPDHRERANQILRERMLAERREAGK